MRYVQKVCYYLSLICVTVAVPLSIIMIWSGVHQGVLWRLLMSTIVTFLGCLALLVVIQAIVGRRGDEA